MGVRPPGASRLRSTALALARPMVLGRPMALGRRRVGWARAWRCRRPPTRARQAPASARHPQGGAGARGRGARAQWPRQRSAARRRRSESSVPLLGSPRLSRLAPLESRSLAERCCAGRGNAVRGASRVTVREPPRVREGRRTPIGRDTRPNRGRAKRPKLARQGGWSRPPHPRECVAPNTPGQQEGMHTVAGAGADGSGRSGSPGQGFCIVASRGHQPPGAALGGAA